MHRQAASSRNPAPTQRARWPITTPIESHCLARWQSSVSAGLVPLRASLASERALVTSERCLASCQPSLPLANARTALRRAPASPPMLAPSERWLDAARELAQQVSQRPARDPSSSAIDLAQLQRAMLDHQREVSRAHASPFHSPRHSSLFVASSERWLDASERARAASPHASPHSTPFRPQSTHPKIFYPRITPFSHSPILSTTTTQRPITHHHLPTATTTTPPATTPVAGAVPNQPPTLKILHLFPTLTP